MDSGDVITFDAKKNFTYVKPLGGGGTGDTFLLSNKARVASRLRDMTERVTTSKGKYRGALPRKRAVGAGSRALPWGEYLLFRDETTDMLFAIKKYVPKDVRFIDDHYRRFVDEIKILFNISHPNIVRIYNYYLFPTSKTGYLQMEFIDGKCIDEYDPFPWDDKDWNEVFSETISAFDYLEQNNTEDIIR